MGREFRRIRRGSRSGLKQNARSILVDLIRGMKLKNFKLALLTACMVAPMTLASAALATPMYAQFSGDWNDDPVWQYWAVEIKYETSALISNADQTLYTWTSASGVASPLLYARGTFIGMFYCDFFEEMEGACVRSPVEISLSTTEFTAFSIDQTSGGYLFNISGPDVDISYMGNYSTDYVPIDQPYIFGAFESAAYGEATVKGQSPWGQIHTHVGDIQSAIPEPATWAMMIAGFGLTGSVLRRRTSTIV